MTGTVWDDDRIERLKELWYSDRTTDEIGTLMGVSKCAITGKAHRVGLKARPSPILAALTPEERQRRLDEETARRRHRGLLPLELPDTKPRIAKKPVFTAPERQPEYRPTILPRVTECCFPIGTPGQADFRYCDMPTKDRQSYCAAHCLKTYVKTSTPIERVAGRAITAGTVAVWT